MQVFRERGLTVREFVHEHNQIDSAWQEYSLVTAAAASRRIAFRMWQQTAAGKTLVELAKCLGISGSALSKSLDKERMPVKHHKKLIELGVPANILPRPENVPTGPKVKSK